MRPKLIEILQHLNLHDRQTMTDLLLEYPTMTDTVVDFYQRKRAGASPQVMAAFTKAALHNVRTQYGKS